MKRLLVMEGDPVFAKQMAEAIERRFPGFSIRKVATMEEGGPLLKEEPFDFVITDLNLPDSDGAHVERLVRDGHRVIVVAESVDTRRKAGIDRLDIVDYILKREEERFDYLLKLLERLGDNAHRTVLIVEDSPLVRSVLRKMMEPQNLRILEARDGGEALKILEREKVDLVLSDYNMPGIDGLGLLEAIRKDRSMLELPFIAISSDEASDTVATFLKHGANDYLKKPFGKPELLCRINNTLDTLRMLAQIRENAVTDPLTGLKNRRYLYEIAPGLLAVSQRYPDRSVSLAIFDIDHFKRVNDTYGHLAGDRVLRAVGEAIRGNVRDSDVVVRFGGEEFLVLMPDTEGRRAFLAAEKLRAFVEGLEIPVDGQKRVRVTVSGGVASFVPGMDLDDLIKEADAALYAAKVGGRNRVETVANASGTKE